MEEFWAEYMFTVMANRSVSMIFWSITKWQSNMEAKLKISLQVKISNNFYKS